MKTNKTHGKGIFGIGNPFARPYGIATPTDEQLMRRYEGKLHIEKKRAERRQMAPYRKDPAKERSRQFRMKKKMEDKKLKEKQNKLYLDEQKRKNSIFGMIKIPNLPGSKKRHGGKSDSKSKKSRTGSTKLKKTAKKSKND